MENKKELTAGSQLRRDLDEMLKKLYHQALSDRAKLVWKLRKDREKRLSTKEIDM